MANTTGSPTGMTAAIHAASGGNPAASATYTLTGPTSPQANAQNTWSCADTCSLNKDTEYFLVLSATTPSTGTHNYRTELTTSDDETNTPADAGWSIANAVKYSQNGGTWGNSGSSNTLQFKVTATLKPILASSNVTATGATLTLSNWNEDWYYKASTGPHTTCQGPVSGASTTLSGLAPGTTYRYYAHSNSTCALSTILATAPDFTPDGSRADGSQSELHRRLDEGLLEQARRHDRQRHLRGAERGTPTATATTETPLPSRTATPG